MERDLFEKTNDSSASISSRRTLKSFLRSSKLLDIKQEDIPHIFALTAPVFLQLEIYFLKSSSLLSELSMQWETNKRPNICIKYIFHISFFSYLFLIYKKNSKIIYMYISKESHISSDICMYVHRIQRCIANVNFTYCTCIIFMIVLR